jgi:hypothetical protein
MKWMVESHLDLRDLRQPDLVSVILLRWQLAINGSTILSKCRIFMMIVIASLGWIYFHKLELALTVYQLPILNR